MGTASGGLGTPDRQEVCFFQDFIYLFLDRGEGREKEEEKHQCVVASHMLLPGDPSRNPALTGNQTSNPLVHRLVLNPLSHTNQGQRGSISTVRMLRPQWGERGKVQAGKFYQRGRTPGCEEEHFWLISLVE